jgi:hypothetical protein
MDVDLYCSYFLPFIHRHDNHGKQHACMPAHTCTHACLDSICPTENFVDDKNKNKTLGDKKVSYVVWHRIDKKHHQHANHDKTTTCVHACIHALRLYILHHRISLMIKKHLATTKYPLWMWSDTEKTKQVKQIDLCSLLAYFRKDSLTY